MSEKKQEIDPLILRANQIISIYSNRFVVLEDNETIRIVFGDAHIGIDAYPRASIVISKTSAEQLLDILTNILAPKVIN